MLKNKSQELQHLQADKESHNKLRRYNFPGTEIGRLSKVEDLFKARNKGDNDYNYKYKFILKLKKDHYTSAEKPRN